MKKIAIICYYDLKEYLIHIKEYLIEFLYEVIHYPLFKNAYDANDKINNYKEDLANFVLKNNVDIVIWWFLDVPPDVFKYVKEKNKNTFFIMYNSDDPCNVNEITFEKIKIFNMILTPCKEYLEKYKRIGGIKHVHFITPGYEPSIYFPCQKDEIDDKYVCDISMICYNLYDDKFFNQYIPRKTLINDIIEYCKKNKKIFKIFGPDTMKTLYPDNYVDDIEYINKYKLYSSSKINIVTHPFCNKQLSLNGEEIPVLACKGLLLMDKIKSHEEIFINMNNCVILEKDTYINQINSILDMYNSNLKKINEIKNNGFKTASNYTWKLWVKNIHTYICELFFNEKLYAELYNHKTTDRNKLKLHWLSKGINNKEICYDFNVPNEFNHKDYAASNNLDPETNIKKLYFHWYTNSRDIAYITDKKNQTINTSELNTNMEQYFMICTALNGIRDYKNRDSSLNNLNILCKNNPGVKINNILKSYLSFCD
ncbi:hypothetical protein Hokovirus_2_167 [Hokovirus HKV1]|uniref:Uncharacterized protein n=1 Tax=Hokovirus HKV1 TaxID=1977638 RepID=A0A1V0SFZ4_9VIRU|nr:hypothetical protein Hokovirus_2_167 [Hokovirus HKV1]